MESYFPTEAFKGKRVHLGITGSVAAYKALDLLRAAHKAGLGASATLTESAARFVGPLSFRSLGADTVYTRMFEPGQSEYDVNSDPFGHLTPGAVSDAFVIMPASATTLARIAGGFANEILSAQALAFPGSLVLAPAMNPRMWANSATQHNLAILRERGHIIVEPDCGLVACNEEGQGKLADLRLVYLAMLKSMAGQDLAGHSVLLTIGPTRETWDGVRFWSNPSSGLMGAALAVCAMLRGAEVHAVCGPGVPWLPGAIQRHDVTTARQMFDAAVGLWPDMQCGIFTAAVADYSPVRYGDEKFKKGADGFTLQFTPNPDILAHIGSMKTAEQKTVGFAAETDDLAASVHGKLLRKNADMIVGNLVGKPGSGFGSAFNTVLIEDRSGQTVTWEHTAKADIAWRILDWVLRL